MATLAGTEPNPRARRARVVSRAVVVLAGLVLGGGPLLVVFEPATDAAPRQNGQSGRDGPDGGPRVRDAAADTSTDASADTGVRLPTLRRAPDPEPLRAETFYVFELRYDRGEVYWVSTRELDMGKPTPTPRAFGRFALELYDGKELIERVRFDFPLLGAGVGFEDGGIFSPRRIQSRIGVLFPKTNRGTKLVLFDRATETTYPLSWPPPLGDGGSPAVPTLDGAVEVMR